MIDSEERQNDLIKNFRKNDWIYGLDKPRTEVYNHLLIKMGMVDKDLQQQIVWRVDDVNNQIIFRTVDAGKFILNPEIPEYLKKSADSFISYLKQYEDSEEFTKVINDEHFLTRYLCKQGIKYALSNDSGEHKIHFILDDIDLSKALIEVENECFTASEIRELARNIEDPNMEHKIYFYRNGVQLAFGDFKKEMLQLMNDEAKLININNSPIVKTKLKDEKDVKTKRQEAALKFKEKKKSRIAARGLMFFDVQQPNLEELGDTTETRRCLIPCFNSAIQVADPLLSKLKSFVFNPNELSNSINELYSILEEVNIEDIRSNIQNSLLSQDEVKKAMLKIINQFWALDLPRPANLNLAEIDENIINQQISDNNDAYLLPIRHVLGTEFMSSDTSASDDVTKLEKLIAKIESICKATFTNEPQIPNFFVASPPSLVFSQTADSSSARDISLASSLLPCKRSLFAGSGGKKLF